MTGVSNKTSHITPASTHTHMAALAPFAFHEREGRQFKQELGSNIR